MNRFLFSCVLLLSGQIFAQDVILPKQGNPITAYELVVSDAYIFYQTSLDSTAQTARIAKDDILMIRKADGSVIDLTKSTSAVATQPETEVVQEDRFPIVNIDNYHGYLLQKGNCVYIPTDSPYDYERAGQEKLKELVQKDGYWQVVDTEEQAHFVLMFYTNLSGRDYSYGVFRTRLEYKNQKVVISGFMWLSNIITDLFVVGTTSDENAAANIAAAPIILQQIKDTHYLKDATSFAKNFGKKSKEAKAWIIP